MPCFPRKTILLFMNWTKHIQFSGDQQLFSTPVRSCPHSEQFVLIRSQGKYFHFKTLASNISYFRNLFWRSLNILFSVLLGYCLWRFLDNMFKGLKNYVSQLYDPAQCPSLSELLSCIYLHLILPFFCSLLSIHKV